MTWLASFFLKFFTSSTLSFVSNIVKNLSDAHVSVVQAQTGQNIAAIGGVIAAEQTRLTGTFDLISKMMNHPIWWVAWCLFVLPVGAYDALIHIKSLACPFFSSVCDWDIKRVPAAQEEWDHYVILSFFGWAAVSTAVSAVAATFRK